MGRVYLGRSMTGQLAAVKVLHDQLAEDQLFRSRFVRELDVASRISGRFSAAVLGSSGLRDEHLWLATEYVPGPSVLEAVEASGPLDTETVLALCLGLLGALETIHSAGVIHRDLKPSNVLLAADGPRVIDFGISAAVDTTRLTATNVAVGTPGYMSPELIRGAPRWDPPVMSSRWGARSPSPPPASAPSWGRTRSRRPSVSSARTPTSRGSPRRSPHWSNPACRRNRSAGPRSTR